MTYPGFGPAESLEDRLGDPRDADRVFSFARSAALDEREEFPAAVCAELDRLGLTRYYVPAHLGGDLRSYEELLHLVRVVARRDLTVAIAHGKTYLGAVATWVGAEPAQAAMMAADVLAGAVVSLALTERDHGSDLLAGDVSAVPDGTGLRLTGEKWLINNATRADLICVLARTEPAGGTRGFSLVLVDKRRLAPDRFRCLPKVRTHGVRGADISGIAFVDAEVPADALVGASGAGLELALKSVQLTRSMCAGMSLGLADQALRLVLEFATGHQLYGRSLVDLPHANRTLTEAYADLLVAEATSIVVARGIHALTGELSLGAAVVKYLAPSTMEATIARLGQVLGARALLIDGHADGQFQKIERDHRIVGIFDGNTLVNLNTVVNQFAGLVRGHRRGLVDTAGLLATTDLRAPLPDFDPTRLSLLSRTGCSVVQALPQAAAELALLAPDGLVPDGILGQVKRLCEVVDGLHEQLAGQKPSSRDVPVEAFALAERYALAFAGAACLHLWLRNRSWAGTGPHAELWADGCWLAAALTRVLARLSPTPQEDHGAALDRLDRPLRTQYQEKMLFSLLPCRLAGRAR